MNWTMLITVYNTRSPVSANSDTTASATVVPASASASCDVCLDAERVSKLPYYRVDMQRFVSNVLTHSSKTILTVLCVLVLYLLYSVL